MSKHLKNVKNNFISGLIMGQSRSKARAELERGCELYEELKFHEAFLAFFSAAKLGDKNAQVNLANMLDAGEGVLKDHKKAAYWYKRAIRQKSPEAAYNLAISYKHQGKIRWFDYWIKRAADMGDQDAIDQL